MDLDQTPQRLQVLPSWLLAQSAILAQRIVAARLSEVDAGRSQYAALTCLEEFGPLSQAQLSDRTGLDRSDVVRLVDDLTAQGFAERTTDPSDRRRNIITVTGPGHQRLLDLDAKIGQAQAEILAHLSPDDQDQLIALLQRMLGA